MADFDFKSQIDPNAIAALAQRQAESQAQMQQKAADQKMKMIQDVANSVGSMVASSIEASKARQRAQLDKNLGDSLAAKYVPNVMAPQQGPGLPEQAGPVYGDEQPLPPVSTPDYAGRKAFSQQVRADPKPWRTLAVDMMNPLKQAEADKASSQALRDRQLTGPVSPATQSLVQQLHTKLGTPAPDLAHMTEQQANQYYDNASKLIEKPSDPSKLSLSDKQEQFDEKNMIKLDDRLNFGKSNRGANGQAAAALRGIGQLDALFKGYKNDLTPQEWEEASIAWARILSSGGNGAARAQIEALIPHTAVSNVKALQQWFSNDPTGTDQQAFAKRMQVGMARENKFNSEYLQKETLKVLDGYRGTLSRQSPDDLREFFQNKGLSYDAVKATKPALAKQAWPDGKPKEDAPAPTKADPKMDALAGILGLKKKAQ